jgi:Tfp pilus assembly protein PilW
MTTIIAARLARGQSGAGLIETMVGILIGLLVVLVVYNMLAVAEGYKRMTTGAADAQITGLISQFISGQDAGNGGNGYTSGFSDLINCHNSAPGVPFTANNTLKPISVLVTKGALATDSDSFISHQGVSPHVVWPVAFRSAKGAPIAPGAPITVQSPNGFNTPAMASMATALNPFWAIAIANDGSGVCELIQISNSGVPNGFGEVVLTQGPTHTSTYAY